MAEFLATTSEYADGLMSKAQKWGGRILIGVVMAHYVRETNRYFQGNSLFPKAKSEEPETEQLNSNFDATAQELDVVEPEMPELEYASRERNGEAIDE